MSDFQKREKIIKQLLPNKKVKYIWIGIMFLILIGVTSTSEQIRVNIDDRTMEIATGMSILDDVKLSIIRNETTDNVEYQGTWKNTYDNLQSIKIADLEYRISETDKQYINEWLMSQREGMKEGVSEYWWTDFERSLDAIEMLTIMGSIEKEIVEDVESQIISTYLDEGMSWNLESKNWKNTYQGFVRAEELGIFNLYYDLGIGKITSNTIKELAAIDYREFEWGDLIDQEAVTLQISYQNKTTIATETNKEYGFTIPRMKDIFETADERPLPLVTIDIEWDSTELPNYENIELARESNLLLENIIEENLTTYDTKTGEEIIKTFNKTVEVWDKEKLLYYMFIAHGESLSNEEIEVEELYFDDGIYRIELIMHSKDTYNIKPILKQEVHYFEYILDNEESFIPIENIENDSTLTLAIEEDNFDIDLIENTIKNTQTNETIYLDPETIGTVETTDGKIHTFKYKDIIYTIDTPINITINYPTLIYGDLLYKPENEGEVFLESDMEVIQDGDIWLWNPEDEGNWETMEEEEKIAYGNLWNGIGYTNKKGTEELRTLIKPFENQDGEIERLINNETENVIEEISAYQAIKTTLDFKQNWQTIIDNSATYDPIYRYLNLLNTSLMVNITEDTPANYFDNDLEKTIQYIEAMSSIIEGEDLLRQIVDTYKVSQILFAYQDLDTRLFMNNLKQTNRILKCLDKLGLFERLISEYDILAIQNSILNNHYSEKVNTVTANGETIYYLEKASFMSNYESSQGTTYEALSLLETINTLTKEYHYDLKNIVVDSIDTTLTHIANETKSARYLSWRGSIPKLQKLEQEKLLLNDPDYAYQLAYQTVTTELEEDYSVVFTPETTSPKFALRQSSNLVPQYLMDWVEEPEKTVQAIEILPYIKITGIELLTTIIVSLIAVISTTVGGEKRDKMTNIGIILLFLIQALAVPLTSMDGTIKSLEEYTQLITNYTKYLEDKLCLFSQEIDKLFNKPLATSILLKNRYSTSTAIISTEHKEWQTTAEGYEGYIQEIKNYQKLYEESQINHISTTNTVGNPIEYKEYLTFEINTRIGTVCNEEKQSMLDENEAQTETTKKGLFTLIALGALGIVNTWSAGAVDTVKMAANIALYAGALGTISSRLNDIIDIGKKMNKINDGAGGGSGKLNVIMNKAAFDLRKAIDLAAKNTKQEISKKIPSQQKSISGRIINLIKNTDHGISKKILAAVLYKESVKQLLGSKYTETELDDLSNIEIETEINKKLKEEIFDGEGIEIVVTGEDVNGNRRFHVALASPNENIENIMAKLNTYGFTGYISEFASSKVRNSFNRLINSRLGTLDYSKSMSPENAKIKDSVQSVLSDVKEDDCSIGLLVITGYKTNQDGTPQVVDITVPKGEGIKYKYADEIGLSLNELDFDISRIEGLRMKDGVLQDLFSKNSLRDSKGSKLTSIKTRLLELFSPAKSVDPTTDYYYKISKETQIKTSVRNDKAFVLFNYMRFLTDDEFRVEVANRFFESVDGMEKNLVDGLKELFPNDKIPIGKSWGEIVYLPVSSLVFPLSQSKDLLLDFGCIEPLILYEKFMGIVKSQKLSLEDKKTQIVEISVNIIQVYSEILHSHYEKIRLEKKHGTTVPERDASWDGVLKIRSDVNTNYKPFNKNLGDMRNVYSDLRLSILIVIYPDEFLDDLDKLAEADPREVKLYSYAFTGSFTQGNDLWICVHSKLELIFPFKYSQLDNKWHVMCNELKNKEDPMIIDGKLTDLGKKLIAAGLCLVTESENLIKRDGELAKTGKPLTDTIKELKKEVVIEGFLNILPL